MSRTCKHKSCCRKKRCTMKRKGGAMSLRGGKRKGGAMSLRGGKRKGGAMSLRGGKRRGGAMSLRGGSVTAMRSAVASAISPFTSSPATVGGKHRRSRRH